MSSETFYQGRASKRLQGKTDRGALPILSDIDCVSVCVCVRVCVCAHVCVCVLSLSLALFSSLSLAYTPWQHERFESYRLSKFEYRATRLLLSAACSWMVSILGGAMPANPKPPHPRSLNP